MEIFLLSATLFIWLYIDIDIYYLSPFCDVCLMFFKGKQLSNWGFLFPFTLSFFWLKSNWKFIHVGSFLSFFDLDVFFNLPFSLALVHCLFSLFSLFFITFFCKSTCFVLLSFQTSRMWQICMAVFNLLVSVPKKSWLISSLCSVGTYVPFKEYSDCIMQVED